MQCGQALALFILLVACSSAPDQRIQGPMAFEMSLECRDVRVRRGGRFVLSGVDMKLEPGDALMVRGANGSGKTSLLRAAAGLAPYDGEVIFRRAVQIIDPGYIRGHELHLIGVEPGLSPRLTVAETTDFQTEFYAAEPGEALKFLGLSAFSDRKVGTLSSGQKRRLSLLRLLISPKALWLLDEPFAALDPAGQRLVRTLIEGHRARGGIVIMALHDVENLPSAKTLHVEAA